MAAPEGYSRVPDSVRAGIDEAQRMVAEAAWTPQQSINGVVTAIGVCSGQLSIAERLASVAGNWLADDERCGSQFCPGGAAKLLALSERLWDDQLLLAEVIRDFTRGIERYVDDRRRELGQPDATES